MEQDRSGNIAMRIDRVHIVALLLIAFASPAIAGPAGTAIRETAEFILSKFGKGAAGQTVEEVTDATAKIVAKHGLSLIHI